MPYRIFDHTADLGVEVSAASVEELYAAAAFALFDLLTDLSTVRAGISREIVVAGEDPADLLINFLREILYLWNGERFLIKSCSVREVTPQGIKALLRGEFFDTARHGIKAEIKAVTYHRASVCETKKGFVAKVVFDV
ncbi:MAG: archease [Deltaproteobacteria bacterium]|nr:archease [Deltaproteobacteria bacterium]